MTGCFAGCTNLTQVLRLSGYITDMSGCFYECTNLTYVPPIPSSVWYMRKCFTNCDKLTSLVLECSYQNYQLEFSSAFAQCRGLKAKSIKVSSYRDLVKFQANASHMGAEADWFFYGN